jgi:hypothetical protein
MKLHGTRNAHVIDSNSIVGSTISKNQNLLDFFERAFLLLWNTVLIQDRLKRSMVYCAVSDTNREVEVRYVDRVFGSQLAKGTGDAKYTYGGKQLP